MIFTSVIFFSLILLQWTFKTKVVWTVEKVEKIFLIGYILEREGGCHHWAWEKQRRAEQRVNQEQDSQWRERHE